MVMTHLHTLQCAKTQVQVPDLHLQGESLTSEVGLQESLCLLPSLSPPPNFSVSNK